VTEFLVVLLSAYLASKNIDYHFSTRGWGRILVSGIAMGVFLYSFSNLNFVFSFFGSVFVYGLFLWLTSAITVKEVRSLLFTK